MAFLSRNGKPAEAPTSSLGLQRFLKFATPTPDPTAEVGVDYFLAVKFLRNYHNIVLQRNIFGDMFEICDGLHE